MSTPNVDIVPLQGGVDQVTTPILVQPGKLLSSSNYEPDIFGGYGRMKGIERFDGRTSPTDATYTVLSGTVTGTLNVGDTVTGATSAATGKVIYLDTSGATDIVVVTRVTGTFVAENINTGGPTVATITTAEESGASSTQEHADYKALVAAEYRTSIQTVPGEGIVRGVWEYKNEIYAFRNNVGSTQCRMYKATSGGWTQITFGKELQFDAAVGEITEGQTVTGTLSGATGVVRRALLRTGTWTSAGVGTLVFDTITGTFTDNEAVQVGGVTKVTANGASTDVTLAPNGKFDFDNYNFFASADKLRMYFADGQNYVHEFDGTRIVPIRTGLAVDKPLFVKGHRNHLFIGIESSLQYSGIGSPYSWTALTGAAELGLGDTITSIKPQRGDATTGAFLATTENKTYVLYGTSSTDFKLVLYSDNTGAYKYTTQNIAHAYYLDSKGITQLMASQSFGDFQAGIMSQAVQPTMDAKRTLATASCTVRSKNQYRLFFSDGTGMIMQVLPTDSGNIVAGGLMPFDYSILSGLYMNSVVSYVDDTGTERIFGGGSDGYVYEIDKGTSFDGSDIEAHILMTFNYMKSPYIRKRYRRAVVQFRATGTVDVQIGYDLAYGRVEHAIGNSTNVIGGGFWDSFTWDNFTWDVAYLQEFNIDTPGVGENVSIIVKGNSNKDDAFTIHTVIVNYSIGRMQR
jgi:hypothetical protein